MFHSDLQVRGEETAENMYAAIENVSDLIARKMRKVKEKAIASGKWDGTAGPRGHSFSKVATFRNTPHIGQCSC